MDVCSVKVGVRTVMVTEVLDGQSLVWIREVDHRHQPVVLNDAEVEFRLCQARVNQRDSEHGFLRGQRAVSDQLAGKAERLDAPAATMVANGSFQLSASQRTRSAGIRLVARDEEIPDRHEFGNVEPVGELRPRVLGRDARQPIHGDDAVTGGFELVRDHAVHLGRPLRREDGDMHFAGVMAIRQRHPVDQSGRLVAEEVTVPVLRRISPALLDVVVEIRIHGPDAAKRPLKVGVVYPASAVPCFSRARIRESRGVKLSVCP